MLARFFRRFSRGGGSLTQADYQEVANTYNKIKELQSTNELGNLRIAYRMARDVDMKYPYFYDSTRVICGSVGSSLAAKIKETKKNLLPLKSGDTMLSANHLNFADPRIGINTSDHTYQSARVTLVDADDKPLLTLKGCTWNLMNYGISLATNGSHMNNPWDFDEAHETYLKRKSRQLDKIISIIQTAEDSAQNHFFLLQEVDIFFPAHEKLKTTAEQQAARDSLKAQFENKLGELGWDYILRNSSAHQQGLVILYNTKNLKILGLAYGVFPTAKQQCRGLAQEFIHHATERTVTLVDLHLDYDSDYSKTIPEFQHQQIQQGKFTIMAGDTNHAPNQEIVGLINNWNNITNLSGGEHGISHHHKDMPQIIKCYDGFFANPDFHTSVHITEEAAEVFKIDASDNYVVAALPANTHVHRSAPGQPWRRGGYSDYLQSKIVNIVAGAESITTSGKTLFAPAALTEKVSDDKQQSSTHPSQNFGSRHIP